MANLKSISTLALLKELLTRQSVEVVGRSVKSGKLPRRDTTLLVRANMEELFDLEVAKHEKELEKSVEYSLEYAQSRIDKLKRFKEFHSERK